MKAEEQSDNRRSVTILLTEDVYETVCEFAAENNMDPEEYIVFLVGEGDG